MHDPDYALKIFTAIPS